MANLAKIVYRPFGLVGSVLAATIAGAIFKQAWKLIDREEDAPDALQSEYSITKVLLSAALQGAIFAVVKAAIDRGGANVFRKATGEWPGDFEGTTMADSTPDVTRWIAAVRDSQDRLATLLDGLSDEQVTWPSYDDEWSIADVASHLGSQAEIFELALAAGLSAGPAPGFEQFSPIWDRWNALPPAEQVSRSVAGNEALVAQIEALTPEQRTNFSVELFGMHADLARFLGLRLSEHAVHTWDIASALDSAATLAPDSVALLIDQLAPMAQRAGTAEPVGDHGPIGIATTDPDRRFTLTLSPEVSLTPADPDAEVALTLPAEGFVRLVYGRLDPDHTPEGIEGGETLPRLRAVFTGF